MPKKGQDLGPNNIVEQYVQVCPYLSTSRTGLTRAFRNGKTIGKTPKNEVPMKKSLNNIFYIHKSAFKDSSKFGLNGPP